MLRKFLNALALIALLTVQTAGFGTKAALASDEDIAAAYATTTSYTITRKGKKIGTHRLTFERDGSQLTVKVVSNIKVTVFKVPVFRFNYQATEIWQNGQLQSVSSEVIENDKKTTVMLESNDNTSTLTTMNGKETVERILFSSNHWNPDVVNTGTVFNTLTGKASKVNIELIKQQAQVNGLTANRYRYTGDIQADTWYDANGRWIQLQFKGKDGSIIQYTLDN